MSGNHELPQDYRPISVLAVLSKILEKAVNHQIIDFLESSGVARGRAGRAGHD